MKVGYSLVDKQPDTVPLRNTSSPAPVPYPIEGATLFMFAILGGLGNVFIMVVTLICPKFRQLSSAFLFHHCMLDAIKSAFCLPFGYSLLMNNGIPHCDVLGAVYMLLMTVSAYNLPALLLNEEYQCPYLTKSKNHTQGDICCIVFGIAIIWFTTVLLHLGVAFLPGSSEFSQDIGNCVYRYGITKNYVIHVLWVLLVSGAIVVTIFTFVHFYRKLTSSIQSRKWTVLHKSLSSSLNTHHHHQHHHHHPLTTSQDQEEVHYQFESDLHYKYVAVQIHNYVQRLIILFCMLISFVLCWYPLFLLTLFDLHYQQSAHLYRVLTILAWVNPLTTPIFCAIIYYNKTWTRASAYRDIYTNAIPMNTSKSNHDDIDLDSDINHIEDNTSDILSFHNYNFHWGCNHVESSNLPSGHNFPMSNPHSEEENSEIVTGYNGEEEAGQTLIM